jgi:hypothetical protein
VDPAERSGTRLEFQATPASSVALDGVWWPHTRESAAALGALVRALAAQQARVEVLMLNPHGWHGRPHRIDVTGRSVRIAWITMLERSIVIGSVTGGGRIDLRLMRPSEDVAPDVPREA